MSHWKDEYMTMIEDCEAREERMNDWERTFIDSIKRQLTDNSNLSMKQVQRLEQIWEKVTARG